MFIKLSVSSSPSHIFFVGSQLHVSEVKAQTLVSKLKLKLKIKIPQNNVIFIL